MVAGNVSADPATDALARLNELSRTAEQTTEAMHSAQLDLDAKLAAQKDAEDRKAADEAALEAAKAELIKYQGAVDKVAAAMYMGGRPDGVSAVLSADSPQQLIDQLSVERAMATEMADQMRAFQKANERAVMAAQASTASADAARSAAEQAAAVRAELQSKQSALQRQIAAVKAQYDALTPDQRTALADPGPPPPPLPPVPPPADPAIIAMPGQPPGDVAAPPTGEGVAVVQAALTRVGAPYSWGATGPDAFDCSGLIKWAFLQNGKSLPRSSQALAQGGQPVAVSDLQPGDIVTFYSDVSHAGIYIGDGMMVHASTYGTPVKVSPISNAPIHNARRY
ncbi:cell wall-associated hydrolase, invasion-associated protein (plasmid) [Mycolicibacterium gilvum Spyr1]|uniref:Cell wall-associated hydrolase, invasion-associated protein n=3 Tax=Mycolicibacterium TaxID=1866885 RepID=E6TQ16_MYCSR|nr:cell wall-associated hydrolase, invasion-associated protein [Mycolicibacterium gilvum Spyr1]KMO83334.1 putative endopeptidase precursor [Mycolicibacterium chlorophenolicum]MCV7155722.1 C40 family peptidase [Mycolicibacterium pyrenivorans]